MINFRFVAHLDTFPVLPTLHKNQPATWIAPDALPELGPTKLLRAHEAAFDNWRDDLPVEPQPMMDGWKSMQRLLQQARKAIMAEPLARAIMSGEIGRVMLSRLDPGAIAPWGIETGPYAKRTLRFHVPLVTNPGVVVQAGPESMHMETGSLFWVNTTVQNCEINWGRYYRISLIFDMYRMEQDAEEPEAA